MKVLPWMFGVLTSFCLMAVGIRELSGDLPVFQTLFVRSVIGLLVVGLVMVLTGQLSRIGTTRPGMQVFRNLFHFCGQYLWFVGIGILPLAEVFALEFTVPLWSALLAAVFLNERLTPRRLTAVLLGLLGVVVIVQPTTAGPSEGALIVIGAAICFAVTFVCTKSLTVTDRPLTIVFYMCLVQMPIALAFSLHGWVWPAGVQWIWLVLIGLTALSAHYCLAGAMSVAEVTTVVTIDYLRLPLIGLVGVLLYDEPLKLSLLLGGALMVLGNVIGNRGGGNASTRSAGNRLHKID